MSRRRKKSSLGLIVSIVLVVVIVAALGLDFTVYNPSASRYKSAMGTFGYETLLDLTSEGEGSISFIEKDASALDKVGAALMADTDDYKHGYIFIYSSSDDAKDAYKDAKDAYGDSDYIKVAKRGKAIAYGTSGFIAAFILLPF